MPFTAVVIIDGEGITNIHRKTSIDSMIKKGAIILGGVGSGATLGGEVISYKYIAVIFKKYTSVRLPYETCEKIKITLFGHDLNKKPIIRELKKILLDLLQNPISALTRAQTILKRFRKSFLLLRYCVLKILKTFN